MTIHIDIVRFNWEGASVVAMYLNNELHIYGDEGDRVEDWIEGFTDGIRYGCTVAEALHHMSYEDNFKLVTDVVDNSNTPPGFLSEALEKEID